MAIGDAGAAKGFDLPADNDQLNLGALEIRRMGDYLAAEIDARTAADALKLDAAKVIVSSTTPAVVNGALLFKYTP